MRRSGRRRALERSACRTQREPDAPLREKVHVGAGEERVVVVEDPLEGVRDAVSVLLRRLLVQRGALLDASARVPDPRSGAAYLRKDAGSLC